MSNFCFFSSFSSWWAILVQHKDVVVVYALPPLWRQNGLWLEVIRRPPPPPEKEDDNEEEETRRKFGRKWESSPGLVSFLSGLSLEQKIALMSGEGERAGGRAGGGQ